MATLGTAPKPRVRETTTGTGTGNLICSGIKEKDDQPILGAYAGGTTQVPLLIVNPDASGAEWEEGLYTIQDDGTGSSEIVRGGSQIVTASSNAGSAVTFSAGTKDVFSPLSSEQSQALFDHVNSTANPHGVTAAQVGLNDTDDLSEGTTNLYYTDVRVNGRIDTRVDKAFVDALNVDADTLDGSHASAFASAAHATATNNPHGVTAAQVGAIADAFGIGPRDVPWKQSALGSVSTNQTLDLSTANYFTLEPIANITLDFTNITDASGNYRGCIVLLTGAGDHTISWTVGGSGTVNWVGGSAPSLATGSSRDLIAVTPISSTEILLSLIYGGF